MTRERFRHWGGIVVFLLVVILAARGQLPRVAVEIGEANALPESGGEEMVLVPLIEEIELPPAVDPALEPASLEIVGPRDVIVGDPVILRANTTGPVIDGGIHWSVKRSGEDTSDLDGLMVAGDRRSAWFSNRDLGDYEVICSVSDRSGRSVHDAHHFAILEKATPLNAAAIVQRPEEFDLVSAVRAWLPEVPAPPGSPDPDAARAGEAIVLAGTIRGVTQAIRAGQMDLNKHPITEIAAAGEVSLGPQGLLRWEVFLAHLHELAEYEAALGHLDGPEAWANMLENVATLMEAWSGE